MHFPSTEFDNAVASLCHGEASEHEMRSLHALLRADPAARDEYLFRVELHARLASDPALFSAAEVFPLTLDAPERTNPPFASNLPTLTTSARTRPKKRRWTVGLAACVAGVVALGILFRPTQPAATATTSVAVAMLHRVVDAQWGNPADAHPTGAALEPGWLNLESGLAEIAFYSGARIVVKGPARLRLVSANEAFCEAGLLRAEVPPQARGFRIDTPKLSVVDLGTEFGLAVARTQSEVHVFSGRVEVRTPAGAKEKLHEGEALAFDAAAPIRHLAANPAAFVSFSDLRSKSLALQGARYEHWRAASARRNRDPSLLVRFDFEGTGTSGRTLHNQATNGAAVPDATIIGCQETEGRWPAKRALEFRGISDRVRTNVPGQFQAVTLSTWVNVQGLDREYNSLFMSDGFDEGKIHWQIRHNGTLDLGVQGVRPNRVQVFLSPPVVGLDLFGQWLHLAVVVDGEHREVTHYVNGAAVSREALTLPPPYRFGAAELGNWNPGDFPNKPPFLIRHFSGAMDDFALFSRALDEDEIRALYSEGRPQSQP